MSAYVFALMCHLLAATVWTGGHLVLALGILPQALRTRSVSAIVSFESQFERIGMPALLIQIASGLYLASVLAPVSTWLDFNSGATRAIALKIGLLAATLALAADARLRVIPSLSEATLNDLAWHIVAVTVISVLFVIIGVAYRAGLLL